MSCQKVEIEDYKTEILGEWITTGIEISIPSTEQTIHEFGTGGIYTHKEGDCENKETKGSGTYKIVNDTIICYLQSSIESWQDTMLITYISKNKLGLTTPYAISKGLKEKGKLKKCG